MASFKKRNAASLTSRLALLALAVGLASPAWADDLTISQVAITEGDGTDVRILLDAAAQGAVVSSFVMTDPDRLVVDIADAVVAPQVAEQASGAGFVQGVEVTSWDDGQGMMSRVTLTLSAPVEHTLRAEGSEIHLTLHATSGGDALADALQDASQDTDTQPDPITQAMASNDDSDPVAQASTQAPDAITQALEDPDGTADDPIAQALDSGAAADDPISQALTADSPLAADGAIVTSEGERPLSGPDQVAHGVSLSSLDFQSLDDVSRVLIGLKGTTQYKASQPQSNLIVVDVAGAFLPRSLRRVLDASEFVSPVRMVRAYRTSSGARVAISLRTSTTYTVRLDQSGLLVLDIAVPENMKADREVASQSWSEVSPASSEEGMSNAYQKEIMIGSAGRTVNPQSAFGSGAGSSDPSSLLGMASGFMVDKSSAASAPYSGRRISLDFVNADIHSIFRLISHVSRLNIVAGDDVKGTVTVRMVDVPWDQALAAILQAKSLGSQRFGNIIRVAPIETIKSEQQSALEAKRAQEELVELSLLVLPLNYASAGELQDKVADLLSSRGSVQVDESSNQLIIKESEDRLAQIRELVRHLDKQTPQVLIEARVVEANSNFTKALGVQWGANLDASTRTGYSTGLFFPNGVGVSGGLTQAGAENFYSPGSDSLLVDLGAESANSGVAFHLGSIPGLIDLDARLSAMESDGWGKVVSSPRITTLDNKTASISQGQRIPFLSTSAGGTNVQFIEASLELEVTPHITTDEKVFLAVNVTNNRADFSQLVQGQPAIQTKEAQTELLVSDGDTTVLGGVFSTESSYSQDRVPLFSKIPLLGVLFKNSAEAVTRNELLVFITPHIVTKPIADAE